jgi:hypothetical protein
MEMMNKMNKLLTSMLFINGIFFIFGIIQGATSLAGFTVYGFSWGSEVVYYTADDFVFDLIGGIIAIAIIAGIEAFGSGLDNETVALLLEGIVYATLWSVLSIYSYDALVSIPILGVFLYSLFTILYAIGCIIEIRSD